MKEFEAGTFILAVVRILEGISQMLVEEDNFIDANLLKYAAKHAGEPSSRFKVCQHFVTYLKVSILLGT